MIQWFHLLMEWMASQLVNLNATLCFVGFPPALISFNGTLESNLADERALFQSCRCSRIQPDVLSNGGNWKAIHWGKRRKNLLNISRVHMRDSVMGCIQIRLNDPLLTAARC